ncbi:sigma-70 family RNA polymerase sigma factor [Streptomyces sp. NPDC039022]|uniref:sigma-70 family RNA polymerase sigma factor n=1 Tax=Streptomyces sp. NPDC039022 TaxID=3157091 RepID=UPI0033D8B5A7
MSDDDVPPDAASAARRPQLTQPAPDFVDLPIEFEAFYLGHQEFFHTFAELHLGSRAAAEESVHRVFLEIRAGWDGLLLEEDLEQRTLAVLHRHVTTQLEQEQRDPAFLINGPIARSLRAVRDELELADGPCGLYEAITLLPPRQFTVIVLRHLMGYPTRQIARYMGLNERTVDYHGRKGRDRLRVHLQLPPDPNRNSRKKGRGQ